MKNYIKQKSFKALTAFLFMVGCVLIFTAPLRAEDNMLLYDGETNFTYFSGVANTTNAFKGSVCFEGTNDGYHAPGVSVSNKDISMYDEIWLFAKVDPQHIGRSFNFHIYAWPYNSNDINSGPLDANYKLIRFPISSLKTADFSLNKLAILYFPSPISNGTYKDHYIYIDEIWAVKLANTDPNNLPIITGVVTQDFGSVNLGQTQSKTVTLSNVGTGPFTVESISISGTNATEFSSSVNSFTVNAGASYSFTITFEPTNTELRQANLVLNHTTTKTLGGTTTTIPLQGTGLGAFVTPIDNALDFGKVAVGKPVKLTLRLQNTGNEELTISDIACLHSQFSVAPTTLTIPAYGSSSTEITFNPDATGKIYSALTITSNDSMKSQVSIDLIAEGITQTSGILPLAVKVDKVTSSTIEISFAKAQGQDAVKVYIAPEPAVFPQPLPDEIVVATLSGAATSCTIEKLAASCDVFIRVEAVQGTPPNETVIATGYAYTKTVGGPGASLDTPLREVHLIAPNILMLVFLDPRITSYSGVYHGAPTGDTGSLRQAGPWNILRKDGTPIPAQHIYRHSVPAGQNYYEVGYKVNDHADLLDVEHRIYLVLEQAIGTGETLHVQGPLDTDVYIPFSDKYLETPVIQVNQVGYCPRATQRYAYVYAWLGDGGALPLDDLPSTTDVLKESEDPLLARTSVVSGIPIEPRVLSHGPDPVTGQERLENTSLNNPDIDAGAEVRQINLNAVPAAEGVAYRVRIPGVGVSWKTEVSEGALFKAFYHVWRALYHERWGRDLQPQWTDWSTRPADHPTVYTAEVSDLIDPTAWPCFFKETTPTDKPRPLSGGHHDAGDFDQGGTHYIVAMLLMQAFEANKDAFADYQLTIPESGNGIPDILDETLYELKGWEQLQEEDGGVRKGVESWRHPWGIYFADMEPDEMPYWTYPRDTLHTARMAGLFAQAARLVAPYNITKSDELQQRAIKAYNYAIANGVNETSESVIFYAAGELYQLTGDSQYLTIFNNAWNVNKMTFPLFRDGIYGLNIQAIFDAYMKGQGIVFEHLLTYARNPSANPDYVTYIKKHANRDMQSALDNIEQNHAHRHGRPAWTQSWPYPSIGNATTTGRWLNGLYARMRLGELSAGEEQNCINAMSLSVDYALGCNPSGLAWLTGLGSRHPEDILHLDSLAFKKDGKGVIPGFSVYGPTGWLPHLSYYELGTNLFYPSDPNTSHPVLLRYGDFHTSIGNNEFTVHETMAPDAELFAALLKPGMIPTKDLLPRKADFTSAATNGSVPLTVQFSDDSNGPIEKWEWNFGDGSVSNEKNPIHTYTRNGSYTVSLKVTCNGGTSTETKANYINVEGAAPTTYTLTITASNGTVVKNPNKINYNADESVSLSAIPNAGYTFTSWSGDLSGNSNPATITINSNKTVAANFELIPVVPVAPTNLVATAISRTKIKLTWQDNSDNETGFKIEKSKSPTSGFQQVATVEDANVTSYDNFCWTRKTYYYRVRAYNASGDSDYSNTASATTLRR